MSDWEIQASLVAPPTSCTPTSSTHIHLPLVLLFSIVIVNAVAPDLVIGRVAVTICHEPLAVNDVAADSRPEERSTRPEMSPTGPFTHAVAV
ncbi:unannotated protein [freshwater metagenome]|uniref:Unannotated protein n=1 Tax=freshwater metagenome TaxID=449393 RepID=A0A6J6IG91_9ZZZZ